MKGTFIDIRFEGDKFSPKKLRELTNLPIETIAEYGETAVKGRYKGTPSPYGMALIKVDGTYKEEFNKIIEHYFYILAKDNKKAIKESGVEDIIIDVETSPDKSYRFSFEQSTIKEISRLNARIDFQTFEEENAPQNFIDELQKVMHSGKFANFIPKDKQNKIDALLKKENKEFILNFKISGVSNQQEFWIYTLLYLLNYVDQEEKNIPSFESFTNKSTA